MKSVMRELVENALPDNVLLRRTFLDYRLLMRSQRYRIAYLQQSKFSFALKCRIQAQFPQQSIKLTIIDPIMRRVENDLEKKYVANETKKREKERFENAKN